MKWNTLIKRRIKKKVFKENYFLFVYRNKSYAPKCKIKIIPIYDYENQNIIRCVKIKRGNREVIPGKGLKQTDRLFIAFGEARRLRNTDGAVSKSKANINTSSPQLATLFV